MGQGGDAVKTVAQSILSYLVQHPQAEDSLEGIAHWWLLDRNLIQEIAWVEAALDLLTAQGLLIKDETLGSAPLFRLNREGLKDQTGELETPLTNGSGKKDGSD